METKGFSIRTSIIVVADTHFGLKKEGEYCDPKAFADFLKWIKRLDEGGEEVLVTLSENSKRKTKIIRPPGKIIFLGDILELWDAPSKTIDVSTRYIIQLLSEVNCEKIYVLGNHDHELTELSLEGKIPLYGYPLGNWNIEIVNDFYIHFLGGQYYHFVHGHQFDRLFILPTFKWMTPFRKVALAFGSFAWILVTLFAIELGIILNGGYKGPSDLVLLILLGSISIPFLLIQFGRKVWNHWKTVKYKPDKARLKALVPKELSYMRWAPQHNPKINIIYGHTHAIDNWEINKLIQDTNRHIELMNIPSWIRVLKKWPSHKPPTWKERIQKHMPRRLVKLLGWNRVFTKDGRDKGFIDFEKWSKRMGKYIENELCHAFLYIDEDGSEFFGWDWVYKKPFWIPKCFIRMKRQNGKLPEQTPDYGKTYFTLFNLGWPPDLINKWIWPEKFG